MNDCATADPIRRYANYFEERRGKRTEKKDNPGYSGNSWSIERDVRMTAIMGSISRSGDPWSHINILYITSALHAVCLPLFGAAAALRLYEQLF